MQSMNPWSPDSQDYLLQFQLKHAELDFCALYVRAWKSCFY